MRPPAISVVVPTKGRLGSLERCLEALSRTQSLAERFEVIVANDGGEEQVDALVASFAARLRAFTTTPQRTGPSAARNAGAAAAQGAYIAFTDDDCEPDPTWLPVLHRALEENPGAAVGGTVQNGAPDSLGAVASQVVVDALHARSNRSPGSPTFFASSNVAFPTAEFRAIRGFDEDFRYAEDRELCERWIRTGHRFAAAPDAVVVHMRELDLRDFVRQHLGYGRGAYAFRRTWPDDGGIADRAGIVRELAREAGRQRGPHGGLAIAGYLTLSQLATATGFAREALVARRRGGPRP